MFNASNEHVHRSNENDDFFILQNISANFLSGIPLKCYISESTSKCVIRSPTEVLNQTIRHPLNKAHPLKKSHQLALLKYIKNIIEENHLEPEEDLYKEYVNLLSNSLDSEDHFVHFSINGRMISIRERTSLISAGTTGLSVWQAGKELAKYCASNKDKFMNKHIIELGSGLGLTGIATVLICEPRMYWFTDVHDDVLHYLTQNVILNLDSNMRNINLNTGDTNLSCDYSDRTQVAVRKLAWEQEEISESIKDVKFDFILAADVIYDSTDFYPLCAMLLQLFDRNHNTEVILSYTIRNIETAREFFSILGKHNLKEEMISSSEVLNSSWNDICSVQMFSIKPRRPLGI